MSKQPPSRRSRLHPPSPVKVGAFRYTVSEEPIPHEEQPAWGLTEPRSERITLEPGQSPNFKRDTFLHELLHACLFASGMPLGHEEEERIVSALTPILLDTLRRNPAVVAYLMSDA